MKLTKRKNNHYLLVKLNATSKLVCLSRHARRGSTLCGTAIMRRLLRESS